MVAETQASALGEGRQQMADATSQLTLAAQNCTGALEVRQLRDSAGL